VAQLTRYWITFDYAAGKAEGTVLPEWLEQTGFGVTAIDLDDAMAIVERDWFGAHGFPVPPTREVVENIDVSTLDDHVRPNMHPPNWRGLWFPPPGPLR
jgi:hypothetical protein